VREARILRKELLSSVNLRLSLNLVIIIKNLFIKSRLTLKVARIILEKLKRVSKE
jgi:hypothetical protein